MNEAVLIELAKAVPNLVVFLLLAYIFLKGQKAMAKSLGDGIVDYMKLRDQGVQHTLEENTKVIGENSEALRENAKALGSVTALLSKMS